jgi:hypothetical protein
MLTGTAQWTAQERVVHGKPATEAVPAEIESELGSGELGSV